VQRVGRFRQDQMHSYLLKLVSFRPVINAKSLLFIIAITTAIVVTICLLKVAI
jgi:hypothetical protein